MRAYEIVEANKKLLEITYTNPSSPLSESTVIQIVMMSPGLRKLHLNALSLSEVVLMSIVHCKELEHLALDHYKSSGEGLAQLGLYGLQLRHFSLKSARCIRDMEIQMLARGRNLEHLNLKSSMMFQQELLQLSSNQRFQTSSPADPGSSPFATSKLKKSV